MGFWLYFFHLFKIWPSGLFGETEIEPPIIHRFNTIQPPPTHTRTDLFWIPSTVSIIQVPFSFSPEPGPSHEKKQGQQNKSTQCFTNEKLALACTLHDSPGPEAHRLPQILLSLLLKPKSKTGIWCQSGISMEFPQRENPSRQLYDHSVSPDSLPRPASMGQPVSQDGQNN